MREKILSATKKITVMLIASLMILGLVPIGMLTMRPHTVHAEGEFMRIFPSQETTVLSNWQQESLKQGILRVGSSAESYLRFDLKSLQEKEDIAEIKEATLRLTALKSETEPTQPVRLWLMAVNEWKTDMKWRDRPAALEEIKLTDFTADTKGEEARVIEIDLTAYLQKWLTEDRQQVSLHLDAGGEGIAGNFAGNNHQDPLWRPCLKVVTGDAIDPDSEDLTKAWLEKTARTGGGSEELFYAGRGKDTYLKFCLKPENIRGAMHQAELKLQMQTINGDANISIYQLTGGNWEEGQSLPQGEEKLIYHETDLSAKSLRRIDVTDAVNDAYAKGETSLMIRISGTQDGEIIFAAQGNDAPELKIQVSDQSPVIAVTQGAVYALGDNSAEAVKTDLAESYTTEDGTRAEIRWTTESEGILKENGKISRPKWFEDSVTIQTTAVITCGEYTRERRYELTVLPEPAPDFSGKELGNYLNLGSGNNEENHGFAEKNTSSHGRWIGTRYFPYRRLEADSVMAVTMTVHPDKQNYLTVKVWKEILPTSTLVIESLTERGIAPVICHLPEELTGEEGFLYLTYPLPMAMTKGKNEVSLRLRSKEETAETPEEIAEWDIYAAYMTQTPYFDPLVFAEQGETFAGKEPTEDSFIRRLIERMLRTGKEMSEENTASVDEEQILSEGTLAWMGTEPEVLAFHDEDDKIVISLPEEGEEVKIHRSNAAYDTYAEANRKHYADSVMMIDYGKYWVFKNQTGRERRLPWQEENLTGIYQDLATGTYWAFLQEGQMADDSVLPAEAELKDGKNLKLDRMSTMVLIQLAEPLKIPQWRISAINGTSVSRIRLSQGLELARVTVKNTGQKMIDAEKLKVICCSYEKGMLAGMTHQSVTVIPGRGEYQVTLPPLVVKPGQTLKIFVEPASQKLQAMTPKLELP